MGERTSIAAKAASLKKAGFSPAITIVIIVLSMPGFWGLFDDTDDKALNAIEMAYPVLANEVEHIKKQADRQREADQKLYDEIRALRQRIDMMMMGAVGFSGDFALEGAPSAPPSVALTPPPVLFPTALDGDADGDGDEDEVPVSEDLPAVGTPSSLKSVTSISTTSKEPKTLDGLIQQQKVIPRRKPLPLLKDLLGSSGGKDSK